MPKILFITSLVLIFISIILVSATFILPSNKLSKLNDNGIYDSSKKTAVFHGKEYQVPEEIAQPTLSYNDADTDVEDSTPTDVLGSKSSKEKRIEVDLSAQKLYAYEGDKKKMSFDVSTGKWGLTPTGEFRIWTKIKYALMTGGSSAIGTYYYLPNVPYTMYFYRDFGIHGTYWHDNFGHPMSHGCINMKTSEAEKLFYWANPTISEKSSTVLASKDNAGTRVVIYGTTPKE